MIYILNFLNLILQAILIHVMYLHMSLYNVNQSMDLRISIDTVRKTGIFLARFNFAIFAFTKYAKSRNAKRTLDIYV